MPLYDYSCTKCGHTVEVRHGFDESYDRPCPQCGAPMRRVFSAAPVLFKGSGFYVTDSRAARGNTKVETAKSEGESKAAPAKETKADSKPASKASDSAA
jgi:putative FmdB family regulatory protein